MNLIDSLLDLLSYIRNLWRRKVISFPYENVKENLKFKTAVCVAVENGTSEPKEKQTWVITGFGFVIVVLTEIGNVAVPKFIKELGASFKF